MTQPNVQDSVLAHFAGAQALRDMPAVLRGIVGWMDPDALAWRPAEDRWSVAMVLAHLAHVEAHGFRARLERIVAEECPFLPDYDPWIFLRGAQSFDALAALEQFRQERARTVAFLESTAASALPRTGRNEEFGLVTFEVYLNELPFHDLGHLRQILELYRVRAFYPRMGAYRAFYQVRP
jgi:hypothetical protein